MSKTNECENNFLKHLFQNVAWANIGDVTGLPAGTAGNLYLSLHTSDPGEAGDQTTNEISYTSYARIAVPRTSSDWDVTAGVASNIAQQAWPKCTGGSGTATHFGIGTALSSAGHLLFSGALTSSLAISNNITPTAAAGALTVTED